MNCWETLKFDELSILILFALAALVTQFTLVAPVLLVSTVTFVSLVTLATPVTLVTQFLRWRKLLGHVEWQSASNEAILTIPAGGLSMQIPREISIWYNWARSIEIKCLLLHF